MGLVDHAAAYYTCAASFERHRTGQRCRVVVLNLKYCNLCRTQYERDPHVCEDEGSFDPETVSINRARVIQAEMRNETKIYNEWTAAFRERMRTICRR